MIKQMGERDVTNHTGTSAAVFVGYFWPIQDKNLWKEVSICYNYYNYFSLRNRYLYKKIKVLEFQYCLVLLTIVLPLNHVTEEIYIEIVYLCIK